MSGVLEINIASIEELPAFAAGLISFIADKKIILFNAPMGAGKTTIIKEICKALGSHDNFSSPTYSIINEYQFPGGKIFHFDLYRLKNKAELLDLGLEEYLDSGNYCFFEWPELAREFIDKPYIEIEVQADGNNRHIRAEQIE